MAEHYPKGQVEAEAWCARCRQVTMHRVDHPKPPEKGGGRLGPCIDPNHPALGLSKEQLRKREKQEKERMNPRLF